MERNYYVKFSTEDIHSGHFSGEANIYKHYAYVVLKKQQDLKNRPCFPRTFHGLKITNCYYIIHLYDSDFQPFIDLTRPDEQKEEKKLNSDLIKASLIKKTKTSDRKRHPK